MLTPICAWRSGQNVLCNTVRASVLAQNKGIAQSYSTRNEFGAPKFKSTQRPVSPDIRIYRFPLPAVTSILFRITGTAAVVGMVAASVPVIYCPASALTAVGMVKGYSLVLPIVKFAVAFPFVFHTLAGLRHLFWDYSSRGLESIHQVDFTSRIIFWTSIFVTILIAFIKFY